MMNQTLMGQLPKLNLALFGTSYGMNRKTVTSGNADRTRQVELTGGVQKSLVSESSR